MKRFLSLFLFIFLIGFVSAYSHCVGDWCCDDAGYVVCNPSNPGVCGKDSAWCDNYNNPQLSCMYNDPSWCCNTGGQIIDYVSKRCCSPDFPFHSTDSGSCWKTRTPTSDNYYTRLTQCEYIWNPISRTYTIEETCSDYDFKICKRNAISQWISGWDNKGVVLNKCGATCISDSNCPSDKIVGNFCNINKIMKTTRQYSCSNYGCISTDKTEVVQTCGVSCDDSSGIPTCTSCTDNEIVLLDNVYFICRAENFEPVLDLIEFSDAEQQALLEQINLLQLTVEEKATLITNLNLKISEQSEIVSQLELNLNEKIQLVSLLTSQIDEQAILVSGLQLSLNDKIKVVETLSKNINDQAILIESLSSKAEEQAKIISGLNLNIQQQADIISQMELTVLEQSIIIKDLSLNIHEQATIINTLNLNLLTKIELISQLTVTNQDQEALISQMQISFSDQQIIMSKLNKTISDDANEIKNLKLTISDSAIYINSLELTVAQQSDLVNQLQLTTQEQASLISQLKINNEQKAQLISNLNLKVSEQSQLISQMNLKLSDDAEIIKNLNLKLSEESELINRLNLNLDEQSEMIIKLKLSLSEEKELIKQLNLIISEQIKLIDNLQKYRDTPAYIHFWNNYRAYILLIGGLVFLISFLIFRKK